MKWTVAGALLLWAFDPLAARVIRVPQDAPTIQAGLDSLAEGDSIFVSRGEYPEFLVGPAFSFVLIGEFMPDSGESARPFVNASGLPAPDTTAILALPRFARAVVESFHFGNVGRNGIRSWADSVTLRNCIVDSMFEGFNQVRDSIGAVVRMEHCWFRENIQLCAYTGLTTTLQAVSCEFSGQDSFHDWPLVGMTGCGSIVENCSFHTDVNRSLMYAALGPNAIIGCTFGPVATHFMQAVVSAGGLFYGRVEGNLFQDCVYGYHALTVDTNRPDSVEVRNNRFLRCTPTGPQALGALQIAVWDTVMDRGALVEGNTFIQCAAVNFGDDLAMFHDKTRVIGNRFVHDSLNGLPSVFTDDGPWVTDSVILRDNLFVNCGYAAHGNSYLDARWNWWGDSTGPFDRSSNPTGRGDTVDGGLQFVPWYSDTSFLPAAEASAPLPNRWQLSVYPNPFNSSFMLTLAGFTDQNFEIGLYNLLGERVDVLQRGALTGGQILYQAPPHLASGLYLLSARDKHGVQTKKVVLLK